MTDQERLSKIDMKLDKLVEAVSDNHAENMKAHGVIEGQDLNGRLSKIESKFWPAVGAASVLAPILTFLIVTYMGG